MTVTAPELFVTNFHRRFTGVSATADAVVSQQIRRFNLKLVGNSLPSGPSPLSYRQAIGISRRAPANRPFAIWHVRRNLEMTAALVARDLFRLPIRIVFTSAAQRLHSRIPRAIISRMDAVVATTQNAAAFVPHLAGVVPHGVDTERFVPAVDRGQAWQSLGLPGKQGIGIVGRIRPEKGTDCFVKAMCKVLPERPDFTAVILGRAMPSDAAFESDLRRQIDSAGLGQRVVFMGEQSRETMPQLVRALSLLVAPARYEGYGMTPLEAMASGVAVVATDTGVYRSILQEDETGMVVNIDDQSALEQAIFEITANVNQLHRMGATARQYAQTNLSLENETAGYAEVYQQLWQGEKFS